MSFRFLFFALLTVLVSSCSRENDLVFPAPQVDSDPDCSTPDLVTPLVHSLVVRTRSIDGRETQLNYSASELNNVNAVIPLAVPVLADSVYFTFNTLNVNESIVLADGSESRAQGVDLELEIDGMTDLAALENNKEAEILLTQGVDQLVIQVQMPYDFDEIRESCKFKATKISRDVLDSNGNPVLDQDGDPQKEEVYIVKESVEFSLEFEIERAQVNQTILGANEGRVYSAGDKVGKSVSFDGRFLAVGVPNESSIEKGFVPANVSPSVTGSAQSGAVMLYEFDQAQRVYNYCGMVKASNARSGDQFGDKVLLRGHKLYVSSPNEDSRFSGVVNSAASDVSSLIYDRLNSGAVYVFDISDECVASERAYLKSPANEANATYPASGFGFSLAESKGELFIGAPLFRNAGGDPYGIVYQYRINDDGSFGSILEYQHLQEYSGQEFGSAISVSSDYVLIGVRKDGAAASDLPVYNGVVEPAYFDQNSAPLTATNSGAAVLYQMPEENSVVTPLAYLKPQNSDSGDQFGSSVKVVGSTLFIGAPFEDSSSSLINFGADQNLGPAGQTPLDGNYGAIYRYDISEEGEVSITDYIKSRQPKQGARFGSVISAEGRYLAVANPGLIADFGGYSDIKGHAELIDYKTYEDSVFLSVFEDETTSSALSANVEAMDLYGGTLVLGLPNATLNSLTESGAFATW